MPVPALNTNYLSIDPAAAYTKAAQVKNYMLEGKLNEAKLANLPTEMKLKEAQVQNYLAQQNRDTEKFGWEKENQEAKKRADRASLYEKVLTAPTKDISKQLGKEFGIAVEWIGKDVTLKDEKEGYEIKGPSAFVNELYSSLSKDPTLLSKEPVTLNTPDGPIQTTKQASTIAWAASKGIVLNTLNAKDDSEMTTLYGPSGKTKKVPIPKGKEFSPPAGWSLGKPEKDDSKDPAGQTLKDFELGEYGKLTPELRGTPEYKKKRLEWIKQTKEASPYIEQMGRQIEVQNKREGTALRKEFNDLPEIKEGNDIRSKYEVMKEAITESKTTNNFVAVDQAIITLYNKMTDPKSVVRESEYLRTAADLAMWNRLKGKIAKWQEGGAGLTQEDREAIFRMAGKFDEVAGRKYKERYHEYRGYFTNYGLDPDKYLKDRSAKSGNIRDKAIAELESRGKEVNEETIKAAMGILGGKK